MRDLCHLLLLPMGAKINLKDLSSNRRGSSLHPRLGQMWGRLLRLNLQCALLHLVWILNSLKPLLYLKTLTVRIVSSWRKRLP